MKRLIRLPLVLAVGFISMIAAAILGMVIVSFEILDRIITPIIRKNKQ
jgi:hypothetical protein